MYHIYLRNYSPLDKPLRKVQTYTYISNCRVTEDRTVVFPDHAWVEMIDHILGVSVSIVHTIHVLSTKQAQKYFNAENKINYFYQPCRVCYWLGSQM